MFPHILFGISNAIFATSKFRQVPYDEENVGGLFNKCTTQYSMKINVLSLIKIRIFKSGIKVLSLHDFK